MAVTLTCGTPEESKLLVGFVGLFVGTIPGGFGMSPLISIVVGIVILGTVLKVIGKKAEAS